MTAALTPRDRRAVRLAALPGSSTSTLPRRVIVVGGGIAGLAAACGLVERGIAVDLVEPEEQLGGRVRAWGVHTPAGEVTMSRGFHAFFRQYYNLRRLLSRAGTIDELLRPVDDYPVVSATGDRDSFTHIPRTPPWNFISFVLKSPTFTARDLLSVDIDTALSLLDVDFPQTYNRLDGESAADFLDRLRFPHRARHLALEVFARSFFAHPEQFSAGELVAMFHSYFLGSSEGLLFDVPRDDFDTSLWRPLGAALERQGMRRIRGTASSIAQGVGDEQWSVQLADGTGLAGNAVVLAAGPGATRELVAGSSFHEHTGNVSEWIEQVSRTELAPPFAVLRLWFDGQVRPDRAAFLGTAGFGPLDNISVLDLYEEGARAWAAQNGGSVIELHAYALPSDGDGDVNRDALARRLRAELARVYPETDNLGVVHEELLIERDCALMAPGSRSDRPDVITPIDGLTLAGDWVRCDLPIALMERAATTGWMAANALLDRWGVAGHELWSVPITRRQAWPHTARRLMSRSRRRQSGG